MEKTGYIEIIITGSKGNIKLSRDNYDIKEIRNILEQAENLLFPSEKKDRPVISYNIEESSVRHLFKTSLQIIIGFNAVLGQISETQNIDFLETNTAKAIETFQENAIKNDYTFSINTSLPQSSSLTIDAKTNLYRTTSYWADAEFYFYGKITNAGGKEKANIHLVTESLGTVIIQTPQEILAGSEENILYKDFGIRAKGKQNSETGEIDKHSLSFLEMIDYTPRYDERYLRIIREKAKNWLGQIDPDVWLREIRGNDV